VSRTAGFDVVGPLKPGDGSHMGCDNCLVGTMMLEQYLIGATKLQVQLSAPGPNDFSTVKDIVAMISMSAI
jgi:hypothetical protein